MDIYIVIVIVIFPVSMINYPSKGNVRDKGFILAHISGTTAGKSRWHELESSCSHCIFMCSSHIFLLYIQGSQPREW